MGESSPVEVKIIRENAIIDLHVQQLTKIRAIIYHLYPGILITSGFIWLGPIVIRYDFPPQFGLLLSILLIALPVMLLHLNREKKKEHKESISALNGFTNRLPRNKLVLYSLGLVLFAFFIWGATQALNTIISKKLFSWLPDWYITQDFKGYGPKNLKTTLILNLILNGLLAPCVEELYFRGYLLPRMNAFGKSSVIINTILFSIYHFWQPHLDLTIFLSQLPMIYLVWRTRDLRLAILTHCLLNLIGAALSFGLLVS